MAGDVDCFAYMFVSQGYASFGDSETIVSYNHIKQSIQREVV